MKMSENALIILKALSWRITGTLFTALITYYLTGQILIAAQVGATEFVLKIGLFWLHEKMWLKLK